MNKPSKALWVGLAGMLILSTAVQAQATSPRAITRRVTEQQTQKQADATGEPAPAPAEQAATAKPAAPQAKPAARPAASTSANGKPAPVLLVRQKTPEQKAEMLRKVVESQKKRAEEGSDSAQYDLGVRYVKGDGVEKDLAEARRWLEMSAKQGNQPAAKKLKEIEAEEASSSGPSASEK